jgi:hypothetical protein
MNVDYLYLTLLLLTLLFFSGNLMSRDLLRGRHVHLAFSLIFRA